MWAGNGGWIVMEMSSRCMMREGRAGGRAGGGQTPPARLYGPPLKHRVCCCRFAKLNDALRRGGCSRVEQH